MLNRYLQIEEVTGIGVTILKSGEIAIGICSIKRSNNRVELIKKVTDVTDVNVLSKYIRPKTLIALNISGKGIVYKRLAEVAKDEDDALDKVLPNASKDEFYTQLFNSGGASFIAMARRADADRWVRIIETLGYSVVSLSLGPFPVHYILPQLNAYGSELAFNGNIVTFSGDASWGSFAYNETGQTKFPLKLDTEVIDERLLIPYAAAFQVTLAGNLDLIEANTEPVKTVRTHVIYNLKFKAYGIAIIACFFVLLFINTVIFTSLYSENQKLADQVSRSSRNTADVKQLAADVKKSELLLNELGWNDGLQKSKILDKIAALLPRELSWREISVEPLDDVAVRKDRFVKFHDRNIIVTGTSASVIPVNEWVARIKTLKWVRDAQVVNFLYNNELNTGQFQVTVNY